jgi:hypothetical protein
MNKKAKTIRKKESEQGLSTSSKREGEWREEIEQTALQQCLCLCEKER